MSTDWFADTVEFHSELAPDVVRRTPRVPDDVEELYCLGFMREEMKEIEEAAKERDLPAFADGLADLIYVTCRAALIWGIDLRPVWDEVHRANTAKLGGERTPDGKILKPAGWRPPDVAGVLSRQKPIALPGEKEKASPALREKIEGRVSNLVSFIYTNHRGETERRRVLPIRLWFGSTAWHRNAQWLLEAFCLDKQATRDFALSNVVGGFDPVLEGGERK